MKNQARIQRPKYSWAPGPEMRPVQYQTKKRSEAAQIRIQSNRIRKCATASRLNPNSVRIGWQFLRNSYRGSPEPRHIAFGFGLRGLADLIRNFGADLVVEQMLEREPRAVRSKRI